MNKEELLGLIGKGESEKVEFKETSNSCYQKINKTTKKTSTRDLQNLVERGILIKKGRTGRGVYYVLTPGYKGDIRGHKGTLNGSLKIQKGDENE